MNPISKAEYRFNPLAFAQKLKTIGVPDLQAEAIAEGISQLIETALATKYDIYEVKKDLIHLDEKVKKLSNEVKETEIRLENKIKESEEKLTYKLTVRLGAIMVTGLTVLTILIKIL